jgi:hypothetical protein
VQLSGIKTLAVTLVLAKSQGVLLTGLGNTYLATIFILSPSKSTKRYWSLKYH